MRTMVMLAAWTVLAAVAGCDGGGPETTHGIDIDQTVGTWVEVASDAPVNARMAPPPQRTNNFRKITLTETGRDEEGNQTGTFKLEMVTSKGKAAPKDGSIEGTWSIDCKVIIFDNSSNNLSEKLKPLAPQRTRGRQMIFDESDAQKEVLILFDQDGAPAHFKKES